MPELSEYHLRAMQARDKDTVLYWRNQPHVRACMFNDGIISSQQHEKWFRNTLARKDVDYRILEHREKAVGLANATRFSADGKSCHWGFYLGVRPLPKGSGSIMAQLMLHHLFDSYDFDTIFGEVLAFNIASLKLHEKFGFMVLDTTRTIDRHGKKETVLQLALKREQWNRRQEKL